MTTMMVSDIAKMFSVLYAWWEVIRQVLLTPLGEKDRFIKVAIIRSLRTG